MEPLALIGLVRSPVGAAHGRWSCTHPAELLATVLAAAIDRGGRRPDEVGGLVVGVATSVGAHCDNIGRQAMAVLGWPDDLVAITIDRHDAHPLVALDVAGSWARRDGRPVLAAAVDLTTRVPPGAATVRDYGRPMGLTLPDGLVAEREAEQLGVSAADVVGLVERSRERWSRRPPHDPRVVGAAPDEVPAPVDLCGRGVFEPDGMLDAAAIAPLADGAAAALVAPDASGAGSCPRLIGLATAAAPVDRPVSALLRAAQLAMEHSHTSVEALDRVEVDERLAPVAVAVIGGLGVDPALANPDGGALALGSAPAVEGFRLLTTAVGGLERHGGGRALVVGGGHGGLGSAAVVQVSPRPEEPPGRRPVG